MQPLQNGCSKFVDRLNKEGLNPALANAFKLYRKPGLNRTHVLLLAIIYKPEEQTFGNQFVLKDVNIMTFAATAQLKRDLDEKESVKDVPPELVATPALFDPYTNALANSWDGLQPPTRFSVFIHCGYEHIESGQVQPRRHGSSTIAQVFNNPTWDHVDQVAEFARCGLEAVPPPDYDWVGALRQRLRRRGQNPPELLQARKLAREAEEERFYRERCGGDAARGKDTWLLLMKCRDFYDWNPNE